MARAPLSDQDPKRIGRYRLTARLGAGGMSVVYLGVAKDGSLVAIKVMRPELADDPGFRKRFGHEVSALTRVKGVCTVRVIEADTESSRPFMVTEYADGPSLAEYVEERGPLSADMLYGLATGLAEALTVIHAAGIVHRDLKPSNVILNISGPKVIDFGIAQTLDATALTKTGTMIGSPGFMAPEQVLGRPGPAADIFVWGITIAYAATGESPFGSGPTDAVLYRVLHREPDTARVPEALRPLVEAALAKDPGDRPAAHELLDRLTNASAPTKTAIQPERMYDSLTETVLALTWQTGPLPSQPTVTPAGRPMAKGSVLLQPAPPGAAPPRARRPGARKGRARFRPALIGVAALVVVAAALLSVTLLTGHSSEIGSPAANRGSQNRVGCGHPPHLSRTAAARRLPDDLPHRCHWQHDRHDGLAGQRRRGPPAVLRLVRRRRHLAPRPGPAARRGPAPAGVRGHADSRGAGRMDDLWPAGHLDQPQRPVVDARGHARDQPAASRRQHRRGHRHRRRVPGRRLRDRGRREPGGAVDIA